VPELVSNSFFFDDQEQGDFNWDILIDEGTEFWQIQSAEVYSGENAWLIPNVDTSTDVSLILLDPVELSGERPVVNFYHKYDTEKFFDAGILQVSVDNGFSWNNVAEEDIIRNGYSGKVPFGLFAIPKTRAWHGDSDGWVATMVDLSAYTNQSVQLRWRFGSDDNTSAQGWFLDDVELMDVFIYNSEACVTSEGGDEACAEAPEWGTVVESDIVSAVKDIEEETTGIRAYPNPAHDILTMEITSEKSQNLTIELVSGTGQTLWSADASVYGDFRTSIATGSFPRGIYFIRATSESVNKVIKVILQ
jgi:extracellular elastinolytic metalloproteinase